MDVFVDTKEKKYVHNAFKKELRKAKYIDENLVIGDIVVADIIIERKTINDLYNSIKKGNLFEQLRQLVAFREENEQAIVMVLIEYSRLSKHNERYNSLWNINQIMINIMQQFNIFVVRTTNIKSTVKFINDIVEYSNRSNKIIKKVRGFKRKNTIYDQKMFALLGLPNIGEVKAKKILNDHNSLMDFFKSQKNKNNKTAEVLYT